MLPRWNGILNNIKFFLKNLEKLLPRKIGKKKRGRPPKNSIRKYLKLIIVKEFKKASLRSAEHDFSRYICGRKVDHSVIHYWGKKIDKRFIEKIIKLIGIKIQKIIGYLFSVMDSTEFTLWNKNNIEFHLLNRITKNTVYPVAVFFGKASPSFIVRNSLIEGEKELYADSWYDDNKSFKEFFRYGYEPIVKPNKNRSKGYWRRKARKLWKNPLKKII